MKSVKKVEACPRLTPMQLKQRLKQNQKENKRTAPRLHKVFASKSLRRSTSLPAYIENKNFAPPTKKRCVELEELNGGENSIDHYTNLMSNYDSVRIDSR